MFYCRHQFSIPARHRYFIVELVQRENNNQSLHIQLLIHYTYNFNLLRVRKTLNNFHPLFWLARYSRFFCFDFASRAIAKTYTHNRLLWVRIESTITPKKVIIIVTIIIIIQNGKRALVPQYYLNVVLYDTMLLRYGMIDVWIF